MIGPHCPIDMSDHYTPYVVRLSRSYDDEGHERGERINGFDQCPQCGLWWPCIEEPDCWEQADDGRWLATGGDMMTTPGPWKWLNYPDGRKLLTGKNNAVIHCPDAAMKIDPDDAELIQKSPDYALLLRLFVFGKIEMNYTANPIVTMALDVVPTGAVFPFEVDQFGCPMLTDEIRKALLEISQ